MIKNIVIYSLLIIFLSAGCKKKPAEKEYFPTTHSSTVIPSITISPIQYKYPFFNPNNANEIIFYYIDIEKNINQLLKYDLLSKQKNIICDTKIISQPKWNKNNWIILNNNDYSISLIKSNGDSLHKIINFNTSLYPTWANNDSSIIFSNSINLSSKFTLLKYNIYNKELDTLYYGYTALNSVYNEFIATILNYRDYSNISFSKYNSPIKWETLTNVDINGNNRIEGICWNLTNNTIYYSRYAKGIYKLNLNSNIEVNITKPNLNIKYLALNISSDGKKIVYERINESVINNEIINEHNIYIMNVDGTNEQVIKIK